MLDQEDMKRIQYIIIAIECVLWHECAKWKTNINEIYETKMDERTLCKHTRKSDGNYVSNSKFTNILNEVHEWSPKKFNMKYVIWQILLQRQISI